MLVVACWSLVVRGSLFVVCCRLLFAFVDLSMFVACYSVFVVRCSLCVVCCLLLFFKKKCVCVVV